MGYTARTADWVIKKAYVVAKAKAVPPVAGSAKYNALLDIVDSEYKNWASEPSTDWDSLRLLATLPTTVSAGFIFALPDTVRYISRQDGDLIRVTNGTSTKVFTLITGNQLYANRNNDACAKIGRNLVFSRAFTADSPYIGGSIQVPAYTYVNDVTNGSSPITIDDEMYLPYVVAAEAARNDLIKTTQYDNILAKADEIMTKMKQTNGGQYETITADAFVTGEAW